MTRQHATKMEGGRVVWTHARDKHGDLVEGTADDLARLGVEEFDKYKDRRKQDREERKAQRAEEERKENHIRRFMAAGGTSRTAAEEDYRRRKNEEASRAAEAADQAASVGMLTEARRAL